MISIVGPTSLGAGLFLMTLLPAHGTVAHASAWDPIGSCASKLASDASRRSAYCWPTSIRSWANRRRPRRARHRGSPAASRGPYPANRNARTYPFGSAGSPGQGSVLRRGCRRQADLRGHRPTASLPSEDRIGTRPGVCVGYGDRRQLHGEIVRWRHGSRPRCERQRRHGLRPQGRYHPGHAGDRRKRKTQPRDHQRRRSQCRRSTARGFWRRKAPAGQRCG